MAKIDRFPGLDIINGLKGAIDFYEHKGQIIARRWPDPPRTHTPPLVIQSNTRFRYFQKSLKYLDGSVRNCWYSVARPMNWSWHEVAYRYYLGNTPLSGRGIYDLTGPWHWPDRAYTHFFLQGMWVYHFKGPHSNINYFAIQNDRWLFPQYDDLPHCSPLIHQLWMFDHLGLREHRRLIRGQWQFCGYDLTPAGSRRVIDLYQASDDEWPPVSSWHYTNNILTEAAGRRFGIIMGVHIDYNGGPAVARAVSAGPPFIIDFDRPDKDSLPNGLYRRHVTPLTHHRYHDSSNLWAYRSVDADDHERPHRPFWWQPTKSDQWQDDVDWTRCPDFNWPRPRP